MDKYNWKDEIKKWVQKKRSIRDFGNEFTKFFFNVFSYTRIPDKSYFGATDSSISLLVGGIYLAANIYTGNDKGIWLLLDKELPPIDGVEYKPVLSTKNSRNKLIWFHSYDIENLGLINQNQYLWYNYSLASAKVIETPKGYSVRQDFVKNKRLLNSFWNQQVESIEAEYLETDLENEVVKSLCLTKSQRAERLKNAIKKPIRVQVKTTTFIRNSDVIAEVLDRANGFCESCKKQAPFIRDSNNTPYLEIHHKIPLSTDGEDTIDNAIALCPNCHCHAHFGEKTFKMEI